MLQRCASLPRRGGALLRIASRSFVAFRGACQARSVWVSRRVSVFFGASVLLFLGLTLLRVVDGDIEGHSEYLGLGEFVLTAGFLGVLALAILGPVALLVRQLVIRVRSGPTGSPVDWLLVALSLTIVAASPVEQGWDDGCNSHGAVLPAVAWPSVAIGEPESAWVSYVETSTLVGCIERPPSAR